MNKNLMYIFIFLLPMHIVASDRNSDSRSSDSQRSDSRSSQFAAFDAFLREVNQPVVPVFALDPRGQVDHAQLSRPPKDPLTAAAVGVDSLNSRDVSLVEIKKDPSVQFAGGEQELEMVKKQDQMEQNHGVGSLYERLLRPPTDHTPKVSCNIASGGTVAQRSAENSPDPRLSTEALLEALFRPPVKEPLKYTPVPGFAPDPRESKA